MDTRAGPTDLHRLRHKERNRKNPCSHCDTAKPTDGFTAREWNQSASRTCIASQGKKGTKRVWGPVTCKSCHEQKEKTAFERYFTHGPDRRGSGPQRCDKCWTAHEEQVHEMAQASHAHVLKQPRTNT